MMAKQNRKKNDGSKHRKHRRVARKGNTLQSVRRSLKCAGKALNRVLHIVTFASSCVSTGIASTEQVIRQTKSAPKANRLQRQLARLEKELAPYLNK